MKITKNDFLKFSKEEIVDSIFLEFEFIDKIGGNDYLNHILYKIKELKGNKLDYEIIKIQEKWNAAVISYYDYLENLNKKYGNDKDKFSLSQLSKQELDELNNLSKIKEKFFKKVQRINNEIHKTYAC